NHECVPVLATDELRVAIRRKEHLARAVETSRQCIRLLVFEDVGLECLVGRLVTIPDTSVGGPLDLERHGQLEVVVFHFGEQVAGGPTRSLAADDGTVANLPYGAAFGFPA